MAVRADNYMMFLEFKEWVDPLTKYDDSEFHTRFCLSKLTVHHLLSNVCQTVHMPSLYDLYTAKIPEIYIATVMNDTSMASFRHHALQTRPAYWPGLSAYAEAFTSHSQRHWLVHYLLTSVVCTCTTTDLRIWILHFDDQIWILQLF